MGEGALMEPRKTDYGILISVLLLILTGVLMVYSSSAIFAQERYHDSYLFIKKEIVFAVVAVTLLFLMARIDYHLYWRGVYSFMLVTLALCILVAIPGIGIKAGGGRPRARPARFTL